MKAQSLIIYGGRALTMNARAEIVENAVIEIEHGRIRSVKSVPQYRPPQNVRAVEATGCLVLPGFVNAHTHAGMSLLRGIADDLPLKQWLSDVIFPLETKWGDEKFVYFGTKLAALELIQAGVTTFNDMYYYEHAAAQAVQEAGIRAVLGQTIVEISEVEKANEDIFEKFDEYLSRVKDFPLVIPAIAPHSIYGVSEAAWKKVVNYVEKRDLRVHLHLAETQEEEDQCLRTYGKTPTEFFKDIGLWEKQVIAAHATCVTEKEIEILGRYGSGIAYNPESNLKLGTRICPVVELRAAGAKVAFGTDSVASNNNLDILQEADTGAKLQVFRYGVGKFKAEDVVRCLTLEGAEALGLADQIGSLEVGKQADIIAIDTKKAHLVPLYNPYSLLVYCANAGDVKHSIVAGRVLMENRVMSSLDESAILSEAADWGEKISTQRH